MPSKLPIIFYKENGLRRVNELLNPKIINITDLPKGSILHFYSEDVDNPEIDPTDPILNYEGVGRIMIQYETELLSNEGNPRRVHYQYQVKNREFQRLNKKFKITKDAVALNSNDRVLTLVNYSYISNLYKYPPTKHASYFEWINISETIFKRINEACNKSSFDNYIQIEVAENIPSRALLQRASKNFNMSLVQVFKDSGMLTLLELWKWIDPSTRETSVFNHIEKDQLKKVNLIFKAFNGKTALINMAYLYSWIEGNENLTPVKSLITKNYAIVQKAVLYFFVMMNTTLNNETDSEEEVRDTEEIQVKAKEEYNEDDLETGEDSEDKPVTYSDVSANRVNEPDISSVDLDAAIDIEESDLNFDSIDSVLNELDKINDKKLKSSGLNIEDDQIVEAEKKELNSLEVEATIFTRTDNSEELIKKLEKKVEDGDLTAADYRKVVKDIEKYKQMKDPYGSGKTLQEAKVITENDTKIDEVKSTLKVSDLVTDPSMRKASLLSFNEDYANNVLKKDMLAMVDSLQRGGIVIRNYDIKEENTILGSYEVHSLEVKPIDGAASTIHFKVPKLDKDGTFSNNGSKYCMRIQRAEVPIRKISPTEVALSSYYGKSFVKLDYRKAYSEIDYVIRNLEELSIIEGSKVKRLAPADVFDSDFVAPFIYGVLANYFMVIELDSCVLHLDHRTREGLLKGKDISIYERDSRVLVGVSHKGNPILVDNENMFHAIVGEETKPLGTIYDLAGIDRIKAPVEYATVKVFARDMPVGIYLSYFLGFSNLLKYLNVKYRTVEARKQRDLKEDEYAIIFKNRSYIFSRKDRKASLILGGFQVVQNSLKRYEVEDLDSRDVYLNLLTSRNITSVHFKEMENTQDYFIDHLTLEILRDMKEPTTYNGLLVRATELLLTYYHPKNQDLEYMRFRGNERIVGFAYGAIVDSIRSYKGRNISGKAKVDISPYDVWNKVMKDESIKITEDINPIQNLKEKEIVTYTGQGGRTKETMTMGMRAYHKSDIGCISEANLDSGDVGINTYLVPNPEIRSLRGTTKRKTEKEKNQDVKNLGISSMLSTSALLAPAVYKDDPKRASFVNVQQSHTIAVKGYHPAQYRTGYEYVIGSRTDPMFCFNSRKDGVVKEITENGIFVEYKDGTKESFELGTIYGKAEGSVYPHKVATYLKVGQKFKEGDNIVYNEGFFERDNLDPSVVVLKNSFSVKVGLLESLQTFEDSCAISKELGERLRADTTKVKSIIVDFSQSLHDVVKVGQKVNAKDSLMVISDSISEGLGFDEESLASLKKISNQSPKAGYLGIVSRIEVLYNGELSDMSESLRNLAKKSNSELTSRFKVKGMTGISGRVTDEYSITGKPLVANNAEIKVYIDLSTTAGNGDKLVMANQLKCTISEVMDYKIHTQAGEEVEALFSYKAISNRIVNSPVIVGTTNTILNVLADRMVKVYKGISY